MLLLETLNINPDLFEPPLLGMYFCESTVIVWIQNTHLAITWCNKLLIFYLDAKITKVMNTFQSIMLFLLDGKRYYSTYKTCGKTCRSDFKTWLLLRNWDVPHGHYASKKFLVWEVQYACPACSILGLWLHIVSICCRPNILLQMTGSGWIKIQMPEKIYFVCMLKAKQVCF